MRKRNKGLFILLGPFLTGFLVGFLVGGGCNGNTDVREDSTVGENFEEGAAEGQSEMSAQEESDTIALRQVYYNARKLPYSKIFSDLNELHLKVADSIGLKSIPGFREEVDTRAGLIQIRDNDFYIVDKLRYSVPYLTRGGEKELNNIARAFRDSLERKNLPVYKLVVSSVLRTEEDVKRLRRSGNPNASDQSAHCYGTTFDITYTRFFREEETDVFMQSYELTKVLAEVLRDERNAGRCLVKYERKEHCFHITSKIK